MKARTAFAVSVVVGGALAYFGMKVAHKCGQEKAINKLREEQLAQASEEYQDKYNSFDGNLVDLAAHIASIEAWLEEECRQINEIYDEIINNL